MMAKNQPNYRALSSANEIVADNANNESTGWKTLIVPALANFSVQYNFSCISIGLEMMKTKYDNSGWVDDTLKSVVFAGAIFGQLVMGYLGDLIGRNKAMQATVLMTAMGSLGSAVLPWGSSGIVYLIIALCRFILGVGVGGVYPLSAAKAAESSHTHDINVRSKRVSWSFFWQTPGAIAPYVVAVLLLLWIPSAEIQWRILLGLGCIPSFLVFFIERHEGESEEYIHATEVAHEHGSTMNHEVWLCLKDWRYLKLLIGTGLGWFIYDITYYGTALFSPTIVKSIFGNNDKIIDDAWQNIIVNCMGFPGTILAIMAMSWIGSKKLQVYGFIFISVCFVMLGAVYDPLEHYVVGRFCFYLLLFSSLNWGPNVSTFVAPSEVYPPAIRGTFNGISAALAKIGALVGSYMYQPIDNKCGLSVLMYIAGGIALVGALLSHFALPPRRLEDVVVVEHYINSSP